LRLLAAGNDGDGFVPIFLRVLRLQGVVAAETGPLLRVLFVRLGQLPADATAGLLRGQSAPAVRL